MVAAESVGTALGLSVYFQTGAAIKRPELHLLLVQRRARLELVSDVHGVRDHHGSRQPRAHQETRFSNRNSSCSYYHQLSHTLLAGAAHLIDRSCYRRNKDYEFDSPTPSDYRFSVHTHSR